MKLKKLRPKVWDRKSSDDDDNEVVVDDLEQSDGKKER
jgi:hypothetical protein